MNWTLDPLAGILSGAAAAMGIGGGGILIIYLTVFSGVDQITAQGVNLLFFIPISAVAIAYYSRKGLIDWKIALWTSAFGIPGVFLGRFISSHVGSYVLGKIFGLLLLFIGGAQLFKKSGK